MSHFAPVVPLSIARALPRDVLGYYHLLLAHDVIAHPEEYQAVYEPEVVSCDTELQRVGEPPAGKVSVTRHDQYIIMDNSLVELGYPLGAEEMLQASKILRCDLLVLPDYLRDASQTVKMSRIAYDEISRACNHRNLPKLLGVVQGTTIPEAMWCVDMLVKYCNVSALSVPRVMRETLGSRMLLLTMIGYKYPHLPIHLLGFSNDLIDDVSCARLPHVTGIDSAVPIRAAIRNMPMRLDFEGAFDPGPRGDYWDRQYDFSMPEGGSTHGGAEEMQRIHEDIVENITKYRAWIHAEYRR
jgi:hypothetical protein